MVGGEDHRPCSRNGLSFRVVRWECRDRGEQGQEMGHRISRSFVGPDEFGFLF